MIKNQEGKRINTISYLGWGIIHEKRGIPCQDCIHYSYADNGNYIMALSDGATSARYAREAAQVTVESVINFFSGHSLKEFLMSGRTEQKEAILDHILNALITCAKQVHCSDYREFSATLLFLIYDGKNLVTCHLGDGAIFLANSRNDIVFVSEPDHMNGYANRTFFTVSREAAEHMRIDWFDLAETGIIRALMMSDGAYLMFYNRGNRNALSTAKELLSYTKDGLISNDDDLCNVLNQMAEVPSERLDDWSVLIFDADQKRYESALEIVSMLSQENEKNTR